MNIIQFILEKTKVSTVYSVAIGYATEVERFADIDFKIHLRRILESLSFP